jgi:hypothetical protein
MVIQLLYMVIQLFALRRFIFAKMGGKAVKFQYVFPVKFKLQ